MRRTNFIVLDVHIALCEGAQPIQNHHCVSYVQKVFYRVYYPSSCSRDDERSEESCEHDDRPTTDRASVHNDRR